MSRASQPAPDPDGARPARVLVADDDRLSREAVASALRAAGHIVETAPDGQAAVDRVARGGIDLVLLDVVMPRLSGLEACRVMKSMTPAAFLPIVLLTVKSDTASRVEGLKIGADDYVCKPFDEQELCARVGAMLRIKRLGDQVVAQRDRLEQASVVDELTGLHNERYMQSRLAEEWRRAERYHEPFACALVEIDALQAHHDAGRDVGVAVLRSVGATVRRCVRDIDVVARQGGDAFFVILPSTHFAGSATALERVWREVRDAPIEASGRMHRATVSIGIALYPSRDVRSKEALVKAAEAALDQARREGGARLCIFQQQGTIYTPMLAATRGTNEPASARSEALHEVTGTGTGRRQS